MSLPFSYLGAVGFQIPAQPLVEEAPSIPTPFWQLDASRTSWVLVHLIGRLKATQGPWQKLQRQSSNLGTKGWRAFPFSPPFVLSPYRP